MTLPNWRITAHGGILLPGPRASGADQTERPPPRLRDGRVKCREDITDGLENAPRELIGLLKGENFGKKIIRVSPDPT